MCSSPEAGRSFATYASTAPTSTTTTTARRDPGTAASRRHRAGVGNPRVVVNRRARGGMVGSIALTRIRNRRRSVTGEVGRRMHRIAIHRKGTARSQRGAGASRGGVASVAAGMLPRNKDTSGRSSWGPKTMLPPTIKGNRPSRNIRTCTIKQPGSSRT